MFGNCCKIVPIHLIYPDADILWDWYKWWYMQAYHCTEHVSKCLTPLIIVHSRCENPEMNRHYDLVQCKVIYKNNILLAIDLGIYVLPFVLNWFRLNHDICLWVTYLQFKCILRCTNHMMPAGNHWFNSTQHHAPFKIYSANTRPKE